MLEGCDGAVCRGECNPGSDLAWLSTRRGRDGDVNGDVNGDGDSDGDENGAGGNGNAGMVLVIGMAAGMRQWT